MKEKVSDPVSSEELRHIFEAGESKTNLARVRSISAEEVERSVRENTAELADWSVRSDEIMPRSKIPISIRLDADLVERLRSMGPGWQTRVNAILRVYLQLHSSRK